MADDDVETLALLNYYMSESYYRRVQTEATNATRKFGSDPVLVLFKGLSLLMEDRVQECIRELEMIREKPDVSLASKIVLITAHKKSKTQDHDAINELDAKVKDERRSAGEKAFYFAGLSLWHLNKSEKAREYIDKMIKNFNSPVQGLLLRGWIELTSDRDAYVKKSVKYFDEALSGNNREPWGLIGKSRYNVKRKNFSAALEMVNQAIVSYQNFTPAFVERMRIHLALQDWDQTLDSATRLLNLDPRHPEAVKTQIIYALAREGKSSDVVTMLGDLIKIIDTFEPQNAELYIKSGKLFARMCGRQGPILNQTKTLVERAIRVDAMSADFTCELGYQLFLQGNIREATKCYRNAMELDETSVAALIGVIRCQLFTEVSSSQQKKEMLDEVSQQLEFLSEVQQTIRQDPDLLYLNAVHSRKTNEPQEKSYKYLKDAMKAHFRLLKGLPLSAEYYMNLNPDFVLDLAREFLSMGPSEAVPPGQAVPHILSDCVAVLEPVVKILPGLLDASYLYAKAKFLAGEADAAVATLQHCVDQDSSYSDAYLLMAQIYQEKGNNSIASQYLESALSYNFEIRDHPLYHLIKAKTLIKSGEMTEAVQTLKMALALPGVKKPMFASQGQVKKSTIAATDRLSIFLELVHAHTKNSEHHEAIKVMQDAINAFQGTPEEIRVTIANADLSLSRGDVEQALTMLRNIRPDQSYYVQAKEKMAYIYLHHRRDKNLYISCYRDLIGKQSSPHTNLLLGDAYMSIQEPEKAIEVYEKVMKESPDIALASKIGQALVKTHDYRRAIAYYEAALNAGQQQHLRFELAELLLQLKMYDKMEQTLTEVPEDVRQKGETELERAMFDTKRLLLLASLGTELNQHERVAQALSQARDKQARVLKRVQLEQPESAAAQKQLAADICCRMAAHENERNKDTEQAKKYYKEALIYCENDTKAMIQLAKLYLQTSELEMCQQYCMQILKQANTSGHSEASMMMADIMFRKNSYDEAIYHYQKLLEDRPDYYEALSRLIGLLRRSGKLSEAPQFLGLSDDDDIDKKKDDSTKLNTKSGTSNDPGYHYCKGLYEWYSGKTKDALQSFNIARRDSDWGELAVSNMIQICLNPDQDTLGGEVLENLDDMSTNDRLTAAEAGVSTAERLFKELYKTPPSSPAVALKRRILEKYILLGARQKPHAEKALGSFMEILQTEKDNVSCLLGMAIAYQILRQTPRARNQLKRISKMQWNLDDADNFEQAWLLLADVYITAGKFDMATELLKKCVEQNKSCCKAFEYLGYIYEKEQSYQDASMNYEKAWHYGNEGNPSIGYKLSFNYLKARRFIDAINICHKVLEKNPQYPKIRKEILEKARSSIRM